MAFDQDLHQAARRIRAEVTVLRMYVQTAPSEEPEIVAASEAIAIIAADLNELARTSGVPVALSVEETRALDWAMNLMGNCEGAETIARLLTRVGAAPFTAIPEPGDTVRNAYTGRTGSVYMVDGVLTHWQPEHSHVNVTTCTAALEVIRKAPQTREEATHP